MDVTRTPMHWVWRAMDVLRGRLRGRRRDLRDLQRALHCWPRFPLPGQAVVTDAALWGLVRDRFSRPEYRATIPGDLLAALVRDLVRAREHVAMAGVECAGHGLSCPVLEAHLSGAMNRLQAVDDRLQAIVAESPRPHDYVRALLYLH